MNESHPWRDSAQTVLFVLGFPVLMVVAVAFDHVVRWGRYRSATAEERTRLRVHLGSASWATALFVGVVSESLLAPLAILAAVVVLFFVAELWRTVASSNSRARTPATGDAG